MAQAVALIVLAVLQVFNLHRDKLAMGWTTAGFFVLAALALAWCALGVLNLHSWARSPIVLAELINLGLAWSFRDNAVVAVVLLLISLTALVGIFAPASLHALDPIEE